MAKEIERKYLAKFVDDYAKIALCIMAEEYVESTQSYLIARKSVEWRIRSLTKSTGEETWYTALKFGNGFVRDEFETTLPSWLGRMLLALSPTPIGKSRYSYKGWEVDVFYAPPELKGLVLAEAEVETEHSPFPESPPMIQLLVDVTNHGGFANKNLCTKGMPAL